MKCLIYILSPSFQYNYKAVVAIMRKHAKDGEESPVETYENTTP